MLHFVVYYLVYILTWRLFMFDILPHILGAIALIIWVISLQCSKKYKMLFLQLVSNILYGIQYVIWGLFSAASMNLVSIVRCYIFGQNSKKNKETPIFFLGIFVTAIIVLALINAKTFLDWIPIFAALLFTISSWQKSTRIICICCLIASVFLAFYNLIIGAYINLAGNAFEIASAAIAIFRSYLKKGKKGE